MSQPSLLNEVSRHRQESPARLWAGARPLVGAIEPAEPTIIARRDNQALLLVSGALTQSSLWRLAAVLAAEPEQTVVWLWFVSPVGELAGLRPAAAAIAALNRRAATIAQIEVGLGPALYLAQQCSIVCASPTAIVGRIGCAVDDRTFTGSPGEVRLEPALTERIAADLAAANPAVAHETWIRLTDQTINGEHAEQLGIVSCLRSRIWGGI